MTDDKVVSLRLNTDMVSFLAETKGELTYGQAIKRILKWLRQFDSDYTRRNIMQ